MQKRILVGPVILFLFIVLFYANAKNVYTYALNEESPNPTQARSIGDKPINTNEKPINENQQPTVEKITSDKGKKLVYLTFDDGPDRKSTPQILKILDSYKIKATFFVIGKHIQENQQLLVDVYQDGHYIGNHTYSHSYEQIYASDQAFIDDLKLNEELIFSIIRTKPKVIRDPGGKLLHQYDSSLHKKLVEIGYNRMEWTIDSYDSRKSKPDKESIVKSVKEQIRSSEANKDIIILLHDTARHLSTIEALPEIIDFLKQEGYEFRIPLE